MTIPHQLSEDLAEPIARRFRALGDPLRVRLLDQLRDEEQTVNALADRLAPASRTSPNTAPSARTPAWSPAARKAPTSTTGSRTKAYSPSASRSAARSSPSFPPS